ncbi:MAG: PorT family protein [Bacteroidales bacterium]|nr:PorT family protein [Bacteroidales bacterium]
MKRIIAALAFLAIALAGASELRAQKYGVIAGASFTSMQNIEKSAKTGFNVGATAQFRLPLGFSIQPSLIYNMKAAQAGGDALMTSMNVGYLELPVSVQWGPDLLLFRPFIDVAPFIGYAVNNKISTEALSLVQAVSTNEWGGMNRFSYGLGLGAGVEVWRLQLICRYNWNFGPLFDSEGSLNVQPVNEMFKDKNFGGVTLSLAFLFGK